MIEENNQNPISRLKLLQLTMDHMNKYNAALENLRRATAYTMMTSAPQTILEDGSEDTTNDYITSRANGEKANRELFYLVLLTRINKHILIVLQQLNQVLNRAPGPNVLTNNLSLILDSVYTHTIDSESGIQDNPNLEHLILPLLRTALTNNNGFNQLAAAYLNEAVSQRDYATRSFMLMSILLISELMLAALIGTSPILFALALATGIAGIAAVGYFTYNETVLIKNSEQINKSLVNINESVNELYQLETKEMTEAQAANFTNMTSQSKFHLFFTRNDTLMQQVGVEYGNLLQL